MREINVTYTDYHTDTQFWTTDYMTWNLGASNPNSPVTGAFWTWDGTLVPGTQVCDTSGLTKTQYGLVHTTSV
jgi:hypothetical protein